MEDDQAEVGARRAFRRLSLVQWAVTLTSFVAMVALLPEARLDISFDNMVPKIVAAGFCAFVAILYSFWRFNLRIVLLYDSFAQLIAFSAVAAILSYIAAGLGAWTPLQDDMLLAVDQAMGFDWRVFLHWLTLHPDFADVLDFAYNNFQWQAAALILLLSALRAAHRLQVFVLAFQITALACVVISALVPALGTYEHLGIRQAVDHPGIELTTMSHPVAIIMLLRDATQSVDMSKILGIITFPSLHMGLAVLFTWGFWSVPVLRWPMLILNILMAVATPLYGSHYMADLLAGAGLAICAIAVAKALAKRVCRSEATGHSASLGQLAAYAPSSSG